MAESRLSFSFKALAWANQNIADSSSTLYLKLDNQADTDIQLDVVQILPCRQTAMNYQPVNVSNELRVQPIASLMLNYPMSISFH